MHGPGDDVMSLFPHLRMHVKIIFSHARPSLYDAHVECSSEQPHEQAEQQILQAAVARITIALRNCHLPSMPTTLRANLALAPPSAKFEPREGCRPLHSQWIRMDFIC